MRVECTSAGSAACTTPQAPVHTNLVSGSWPSEVGCGMVQHVATWSTAQFHSHAQNSSDLLQPATPISMDGGWAAHNGTHKMCRKRVECHPTARAAGQQVWEMCARHRLLLTCVYVCSCCGTCIILPKSATRYVGSNSYAKDVGQYAQGDTCFPSITAQYVYTSTPCTPALSVRTQVPHSPCAHRCCRNYHPAPHGKRPCQI